MANKNASGIIYLLNCCIYRYFNCLVVLLLTHFFFSGGKLVDPSPAIQKELKTELEKLEKQYGGGSGVDMTSFPSFKFDEPKLDPIDEAQQVAKKK